MPDETNAVDEPAVLGAGAATTDTPPPQPPVSELVKLTGFPELVAVVVAVAETMTHLQASGATLTDIEHDAVVLAAAQITRKADEMTPA
jgi:hypothetical protein